MKIVRIITINRSPEEIFSHWRQLESLPRFMSHLVSVKALDERTSRWIAKAPAGQLVVWDAEITDEQPNRLLAWRSRAGADVRNSGTVRFHQAPSGRGTELSVELEYMPPAGVLGRTVARWFGEEPSQQLAEDLRRFK